MQCIRPSRPAAPVWRGLVLALLTAAALAPAASGPLADAGPDQVLLDGDGAGQATVQLDGSASSDPLGAGLQAVWQRDGQEIATGLEPTVALLVGSHLLRLTVSDGAGLVSDDEVLVTVQAGTRWLPVVDRYVGAVDTLLEVAAAEGPQANDPPPPTGGAVTVELLEAPAVGTLTGPAADGSFAFQPPSGFTGLVRFRYRLLAGSTASAPGLVCLVVGEAVGGERTPLLAVHDGGDFASAPAAWLAAAVPGRIWDSAAPGPGVPRLRATGPRVLIGTLGGSLPLPVVGAPGQPVSYCCLDSLAFGNGSGALSVQADGSGTATATLSLNKRGRHLVLAASPAASGQVRFVVEVR